MNKETSIKNLKNMFLVLSSQFTVNIGFTLIEIIVSLAVISLIVGITIAGYSRLNQRQNLISAGQTMKNILRDAQSRAYNGEIDCIICNCSVGSSERLIGWVVDFTNRNIFGRCDSKTFPSTFLPFKLSDDINIVIIPPAITSLLFHSYPPSVSNSVTICLSDSNLASLYYKINVEGSGKIQDQGNLESSCT